MNNNLAYPTDPASKIGAIIGDILTAALLIFFVIAFIRY